MQQGQGPGWHCRGEGRREFLGQVMVGVQRGGGWPAGRQLPARGASPGSLVASALVEAGQKSRSETRALPRAMARSRSQLPPVYSPLHTLGQLCLTHGENPVSGLAAELGSRSWFCARPELVPRHKQCEFKVEFP